MGLVSSARVHCSFIARSWKTTGGAVTQLTTFYKMEQSDLQNDVESELQLEDTAVLPRVLIITYMQEKGAGA